MDEFDSLEKEGYATLKSSNESETRVWCFLFLCLVDYLNYSSYYRKSYLAVMTAAQRYNYQNLWEKIDLADF